ncbi:hypothetical protein Nmel_016628, partial [Mimus melanotis]
MPVALDPSYLGWSFQLEGAQHWQQLGVKTAERWTFSWHWHCLDSSLLRKNCTTSAPLGGTHQCLPSDSHLCPGRDAAGRWHLPAVGEKKNQQRNKVRSLSISRVCLPCSHCNPGCSVP